MKRRIGLMTGVLLMVILIALTSMRTAVPVDKLECIGVDGDGTRITVKGQITAPLRFVAGIEYENTENGKTKIRILSTYRFRGQKEFTVNVNNSEGTVREIVFYDKDNNETSIWTGEIQPVQSDEPISDTVLSAAPDSSAE